jgi:hypothetical protein
VQFVLLHGDVAQQLPVFQDTIRWRGISATAAATTRAGQRGCRRRGERRRRPEL